MPNRARILTKPSKRLCGTRRSRHQGRRLSNRRRNRALKRTRRKGQTWESVTSRKVAPSDQLNRDLTIECKGQRFYDSSQNCRVGPLARLPTSYKGFQKLGIYSSNKLCAVRSRFIGRCTNKSARFFGIDPKKDRHWAAMLRVIACCGVNAADFKSLMRIKDLKVRGIRSAYIRAISGFIGRCPMVHVKRALDYSFE